MTDAPDDQVFEAMREQARLVWGKYDDEFGYRSEKLAQLDRLTNVKDNWWTIWGMFDHTNQHELLYRLKDVEPTAFVWAVNHGVTV